MIEKNHPECGEFVAVLKELNEDEMVQLECEAREIYEWDLHSHHRTGYREGREQGRTEGEFFNIISLTKKKLEKEKTVEVIAEEVETDIALIEQITKIISELPVYTVEGVYEKLKEDKHFHQVEALLGMIGILDCRFFEFQETEKSVAIIANKLYEEGLIILKNAQPTEAKNTDVF